MGDLAGQAIADANREIADRGFATLADLQTWDDLREQYRAIHWAWPKWLPIGFVCMLAAPPGVGKSLFAVTIAKLLGQGGEWPDGHLTIPTSKKILWVETESGEAFHILRANGIGLPLSTMVRPVTHMEGELAISLTDTKHRLRIASIAALPAVEAIVVDSLSGGHNVDENSTAAGGIMAWLSHVAKEVNKPVLVIHHMNKTGFNTSGAPPTMANIRGSTAILQHARTIWTLDTPDPEIASVLRLACVKSNLGAKPRPLNVYIDVMGRMQWDRFHKPGSPDEFSETVRTFVTEHPEATDAEIAQREGVPEMLIAGIRRAMHAGTPIDMF